MRRVGGRLLTIPIVPIGPSIAYVPLTQGKFSLIDRDNARWLGKVLWCAIYNPDSSSGFYTFRRCRKGDVYGPTIHGAVLPLTDGRTPDHINGDGLDNRRCNLRPASQHQQTMNTSRYRNNRSGFKGVRSPSGKIKKYIARIRYNGELIYLGYIEHAEDAARAYDRAAKYYFGEYAKLNFPHESTPPPTESEMATWPKK